MHPGTWLARACAGIAVSALCAGAVTGCAAPPPRLLLSGIVADHSAPGGIRAVPAEPALADAAGSAASGAADRRWLAASPVPGSTPAQRRLARGALIDLRLLTQPDGAMAAAWYGHWKYAWPRDSSWAAAAFAASGHFAESLRILRFLARVQFPDGTFAARYTLAGAPVRTGLAPELDGDGWFPWAVWIWYAEQPGTAAARRGLAGLWPAVRRAAAAATAALSSGGLPAPSPDYWEQRVAQPTIGTAGPLLAGLHAAIRLAASRGDDSDARRWGQSAMRLDRAIELAFKPDFNRFPSATGGPRAWFALFGAGAGAKQDGLPADAMLNGPDAAIAFLGPPFEPGQPGGQQRRRPGGPGPDAARRGDPARHHLAGGPEHRVDPGDRVLRALRRRLRRRSRRHGTAGLAGRSPDRGRGTAGAGQRRRAAGVGRAARLDLRHRAAGAGGPAAPAAGAVSRPTRRAAARGR